MQYNYDYTTQQDGPFYFFPIIDESVYNSYLNQNIMPFQNYDSSSYINNYYNFNRNGSTWQNQQNLTKVQERNINNHLLVNKGKNRNKISEQEDLYIPESETVKKNRKKQQNIKRNIVSSLINQALTFLTQQKRSRHLVQKLLQTKDDKHIKKNTIESYFEYQLIRKSSLSRYMNIQSFISFLIPQQNQAERRQSYIEKRIYFQIALAIVVFYFKNQAVSAIIHSKKILSSNKKYHFTQVRQILRHLKEIKNVETIKK